MSTHLISSLTTAAAAPAPKDAEASINLRLIGLALNKIRLQQGKLTEPETEAVNFALRDYQFIAAESTLKSLARMDLIAKLQSIIDLNASAPATAAKPTPPPSTDHGPLHARVIPQAGPGEEPQVR